MFTNFTRLFCMLLCVLTMSVSKTSAVGTTLSRGDIAIVSFSGISGGTHFSFVTWVPLAPGTVINFTTNPFQGSGSANAASNAAGSTSIVRWTNTEGAAIPAGTVISLYRGAGESGTDVCTRGSQAFVPSSDNVGSPGSSLINFSVSGKALFAYQGSDYASNTASATTTTTFNGNILFGFCYQGTGAAPQGSNAWLTTGSVNNFKSYLPSELGASSSYHINNLGVKAVDGQYTGPRTGAASLAAYQAMVTNPANWTVTSVNATPSVVDYTGFASLPTITATITATNVTCNGGSDGTATITAVSGGTTPYTYSWAPSGGSASTATGLTANTYTCTITDATSASITKTITVTQPAALTVSGANTLCATTTLTASLSGGTWSSSNTSVATVGTGGVVTGVAAGTATISYVHSCGTATKGVTVNLADPGTITGLQTVCVTAFIAHGTTGTAGGTWVSSNVAVGTINSATGTMGGASNGTTTVSYTVTNSCGSMTATKVNTVYALTDPGTISGPSSVCVGSDVTMASSSTTTSTPPYSHAWSSSATAIATVNASTGVVTGLSSGTSRISYTATGCGTFRTFFTMNVLPTSVSTITGTTTVTAGSTTTLSNTTAGGTWSSTNTAVGTVSTSGVVTGIAAGTTTISYLISNSCGTSAATVNVTVIGPLAATQSQTNVTCNGGSDGTATVTASGGTTPYTYTWAGGSAASQTTSTASGLSAGNYTCTITDAASTTVIKTFTITEPAALSVSGSGTLCATTTLTASLSGGTWSSSNTSVATVGTGGVVTGVAAGTATISYVHSCGTATKGVTVNLADPGTITGLQTVCVTAFIAHSSTGTAGGTWVSSNTAVGTINPATGTMGGASNGTTTVSYTVTNSCGSMTATKVNTVYALTDPGTISGPSSVCVGSTVTMTSSSTTTSSPPYSYAWSSSATAIATVNASTGVVTGIAGGTSRISYTATGCGTFRTFFTMNVLPTSVSTITGTTTVTAGSTTTLSNTTAGGTWSSTNTAVGTVSTSGVVTGIATGTTTISYLISNSCGTSVATVNVTVIGALAATQSQTNVSCNGGSDGTASVTASGGTTPYTYTWTGGSAASQTTSTASGLSAGNYTCTITDAASATVIKTFTITEPAALSVSGSGTLCATTTLTASLSGGTWSSSNTDVATVGSTGIVTGIAAGTAEITYVHSCGTATKGVTVNLANPGTINGLQTVCVTAFIAHSSTGTAGGTWVSSNTAVGTINPATGTMGGASNGTTTVSYTVTNSCGSMTATKVNTVYALTDPGTISGPSSVCVGSTVTMTSSSTTTSSPPYSYAWSSSATAIATVNASTGVVTGIAGGTSRISYTATGCGTFRTFFTMNVLPNSVPAITGTTTVVAGTTTTLSNTTSGGTWSSTNTAVGTVSTSGVVTGITPGTTTISYLISNSCGTFAATVNVTVLSSFDVTQSQTNVSCNGGSNGTASVSVSGGTAPYTYTWVGGSAAGQTTSSVSGLTAGSYTCTVADAASNSAVKTFTITEPSALTSSVSATTNVSCNGLSNGSATVAVSGGTPSYSFSWAPVGGSAATATGLAAGTYTVTITDANSCPKTQTVTITQPSALTSSVSATTNVNCYGLSNGSATVAAGGGTPSYNYSWAPSGGSAAAATGLAAGTYTVTITDANSCVKTQTVTVTQPSAALTISSTTNNSPVCVGSNLNFNSSVTGGTTPYNYSWSGPSAYSATIAAPSITSVAATAGGVYSLSVTDANGCTAAGTHTVSAVINTRPVLTSIGNSGPVCATFNLGLTSTAASGTTPYSYSWSGPNSFSSTVQNPTVAAATTSATGTYTLNVTDANGCTLASAGTTAAVVNPRPAITSIGNNSPVCAGSALNFNSAASGGTGTLSYSWAGPGTFTSSIANPTVASAAAGNNGIYTLTVTDGLGCHGSGTNTVSATVNARPSLSAIGNNGPICAGATLNLTRTVTGGTNPYGYSWSGPNTFSSTASAPSISGATTAATGVYTLVITDANGCIAIGANTTSATVNPRPVIGSIGNNGPICSGLTLNLNSTASGGTGTLSYSWAGPNTFSATTASPSISGATSAATGTYTLTVTDINSCTASGTNTTTATVNDRPVIASISNNGPICAGNTLNLTSAVTGGTAPLVYAWSGPNSFSATTSNTSVPAATTAATGTYTLVVTDANGCIPTSANTTAATVNPLPAAITGNANICIGSTTTLSTITTAGTWSSSDPATASVDGSGVVTGNILGTATISYTLSTGCYMTREVSVNPFPSAISGPSTICAGANITLTNTLSGGSWSSSNTTVATINATSGVVTGLAAGTVNFSYTSDKGCMVSTASPITNMISAIAGASGSCTGLSVTLTDATTGGLWSSANSAIASVGSASGIVTANSGGSTTITYTVGSCYRVQPMGIATAPPDITGGTEICIGATTTLSNTFAGGTWYRAIPSSFVADVTYTGGVVTGVGAGTVVITYILSPSCMTSTIVTVDPTPVITGSTTICNGTTSTLTSSVSGGTWSTGNASVATIDASGTVTAVSVGSANITYMPPTGCYKVTVITVTGAPAPITGPATICIGTTATYSDATSGGLGWTSSTPGVATINNISGIATGLTTGTTIITFALATSCISTKIVTVTPLPDVITGTATVCGGSTTTLTSAPAGGTWLTSTSSVATVGTNGVVTGAAAGTATIYYSLGAGCNRGQVVTVNAQPAVITGATSLCVGSSATLASTTSGGTWTSSNTSAATINASTGLISGAGAGTSTISYTLSSGCSRTTVVTVTTVNAITGNVPLCVAQTAALSNATTGGTWLSSNAGVASVNTSGVVTGVASGNATISYVLSAGCVSTTIATVNTSPATIAGTMNVSVGSTTTLSNATSGGTWSSSNPSLGSIDASGVVTGIAEGTITVTYSIGGCYRTASVTIDPALPPIPGPLSLCVGGTVTLPPPVIGLSWTSSNPAVATIGIISGVVNGISPGTTTITFTFYSGATVTKVMTVYPIPSAITGPSSVCVGANITLANADAGGTWQTGSTTVATIGTFSGIVTGAFNGSTVVTYTLNGCTAMKPITVGAIPGTFVLANNICVGTVATGSGMTSGTTWSSANPAVASITPTGTMTGTGAGTTTISYTFTSTGCARTQVVSVNTMAANTGTATACTGATTTLSNASAGGTWSSGSTSIATVATTGIVTGVATGTSVITYTFTPGCKAYTTVTVIGSPAAITGPTSVCPGSSVTLVDGTASGTWSSSAGATATVGASTGVVNGVATGAATISYTLANGCYKTITMVVKALPAAITGSPTVCKAATTSYTDASGAGAWVSSNTAVGTIGASSGVLTGITAGTTNITFTATATACSITKTVTVNTAGTITGPLTVSKAASLITPAAYSSTETGGVWSTSMATRATIGGSTGLLTGVSAGTVNVLYTANGCLSGLTITITTPREGGNQLAAEIANTISVFPNPTSGTFTVRSGAGGTFTIYTLEGKESGRYAISEGDNMISMPKEFAAGIYMCRFAGDDGSNTMVRLVYQP